MTGLGWRVRRPRIGILAAAAVLLGGTLSGCAGQEPEPASPSPSAQSPSETEPGDLVQEMAAAIRSYLGENMASRPQAECVSQQLVDELGEEGARAVADAESLESLSDDQQLGLARALNECIPGSAFADEIAAVFYRKLGVQEQPAPSVVRCLSTRLDGVTGDVVIESGALGAKGEPPRVLIAAYEACIPDTVLHQVFVAEFQSQGVNPEAARCIADEIVGKVTLEQIVRIGLAGGRLPPSFRTVVQAALRTCGPG